MAGTITHEWNGTTLIITSDSGTSSCDLKGDKGDMGIRGAQGIPGEPWKTLAMYPVGAVYISVNETSPATLFGGEWERLENRFLIGAGDTYTNESTGGATSTPINYSNLPTSVLRAAKNLKTNAVSINNAGWTNSSIAANTYTTVTVDSVGTLGDSYAGKSNISIMPPYLAVYMWQRKA